MSIIDTYAENPNKLTTENAESEERSVYKSATDGLIKRCVRAEGKHQELAFDYQLLIEDRNEKVSKLEQQLKDADTHIDALQSVRDAFKRLAASRYARLAELEQQIKANEGVIELQAQRLATTRVQFDSIAEAARACADAAGLDP